MSVCNNIYFLSIMLSYGSAHDHKEQKNLFKMKMELARNQKCYEMLKADMSCG